MNGEQAGGQKSRTHRSGRTGSMICTSHATVAMVATNTGERTGESTKGTVLDTRKLPFLEALLSWRALGVRCGP